MEIMDKYVQAGEALAEKENDVRLLSKQVGTRTHLRFRCALASGALGKRAVCEYSVGYRARLSCMFVSVSTLTELLGPAQVWKRRSVALTCKRLFSL